MRHESNQQVVSSQENNANQGRESITELSNSLDPLKFTFEPDGNKKDKKQGPEAPDSITFVRESQASQQSQPPNSNDKHFNMQNDSIYAIEESKQKDAFKDIQFMPSQQAIRLSETLSDSIKEFQRNELLVLQKANLENYFDSMKSSPKQQTKM